MRVSHTFGKQADLETGTLWLITIWTGNQASSGWVWMDSGQMFWFAQMKIPTWSSSFYLLIAEAFYIHVSSTKLLVFINRNTKTSSLLVLRPPLWLLTFYKWSEKYEAKTLSLTLSHSVTSHNSQQHFEQFKYWSKNGWKITVPSFISMRPLKKGAGLCSSFAAIKCNIISKHTALANQICASAHSW